MGYCPLTPLSARWLKSVTSAVLPTGNLRCMHKPIKYVEKGLTYVAHGAWGIFNTFNKINPGKPLTPAWSDLPLLKSTEKVKPPLGWPRETDSLCPVCVREARQEILDGKRDYKVLLSEKIGEIKATILERDGKILMVKDCPVHGHFEDVMAIDPAKLGAWPTSQILRTQCSATRLPA